MMRETPLAFVCDGDWLYGILHHGRAQPQRGVLIIVGGPQYRVGSHRQFVLLARALAQAGVPAFRFDYRGMGDSEGTERTFDQIDADLRVAVDAFMRTVPGMREVVLWGLCDAASAAMFYAPSDPRVTGLVLVNPWARTEQGVARAYLRHYYVERLFSIALWRKAWHGEFELRTAVRSFAAMVRAGGRRAPRPAPDGAPKTDRSAPLPDRMLANLRQFRGRILLILCGGDLTAHEFRAVVAGSRAWRKLLESPRVTRRELEAANHTFSRPPWRDRVFSWSIDWVGSW